MSLYLENKKYKRENNPNLCLLLDCSKANYQIIKVSRIKENFSQIFENPVHYYLNLNIIKFFVGQFEISGKIT